MQARMSSPLMFVVNIRSPTLGRNGFCHPISEMMWARTQRFIHTAVLLVSLGRWKISTELICEVFVHLDAQGLCWYVLTTIFIIYTLITNARHVDCSTKLQNHANSGSRSSVPLDHYGTTIPRNSLLAHFRK